MIRAILRAQWLSLRSFRLASGRRGAIIKVILSLGWYGFWIFVAGVLEELAASRELSAQIAKWLPIAMACFFAFWQLTPLAAGSLGGSLDLRKLLLYPVSRRALFVVEVLLRITTGLEMLLVLAGISIGMLRNPQFGGLEALPRVLAAFVLFAAFNLLLAAGLRNLIERLLSRKGLREVLALIMMLIGVMPRLLMVMHVNVQRVAPVAPVLSSVVWPWTAAAQLMIAPNWASAITLAAWAALAYAFGHWQFQRTLRYDALAAQATVSSQKERSFTARLYRLPSLLLPDPLGAMVEKELRSLSRTPRFRLVFVMGFSFGLIVWLPMVLGGRNPHSAMASNFLTVVSVYALTLLGQVTYWNAFGFDRSAAQLYFAAPVPLGQVLAGKNIAAALFIFLEIAAVSLVCALLPLGISSGKIAEAFLATGIAALYLLGLGNLGSVNYPRGMSAHRASAGGSRGRSQGLMFLLYPVALLPVALAYLARYAFDSQIAFSVILVFAAGLGIAVYWMSMESAVATAQKRREAINSELSSGEGPMVSD